MIRVIILLTVAMVALVEAKELEIEDEKRTRGLYNMLELYQWTLDNITTVISSIF